MEKHTESALGKRTVVEAVAKASPLEVVSMIYTLPSEWFAPSASALRGFCRLVGATTGQCQAEVIKAVRARSPGLVALAGVADHIFLANCMGRQGNAQAVKEMFVCWGSVIRSPQLMATVSTAVGTSALSWANACAWEELLTQDPSQAHRPDKIRLACFRACSAQHLEWALSHAETCPWQERIQACWSILARAWDDPKVSEPVESPELAVHTAHQLCLSLPWEENQVVSALESTFNHPRSPFRFLLEHEYDIPPLTRLRSLATCQTLAECLESHGVRLEVGSETLASQLHFQQSRLCQNPTPR